MVNVYVDLKQIATGLDKDDLIKVIAAWYAEQAYGVEAEEDDLADVANYIAEDDDDDYDDDYDDENDDIDAETAHLMEINRRKNEEALGL